jgi:hypothetical protein
MQAGRELDILVAEKVMGKTVRSKNEVTNNSFKHEYDELVVDLGNGRYEFIRHYSTDIADAWEVVEQLNDPESYLDIKIQSCIDGWFVDYCNERTVAETIPLVICIAALKAVGWEDERE